jgi:hypothetical protein
MAVQKVKHPARTIVGQLLATFHSVFGQNLATKKPQKFQISPVFSRIAKKKRWVRPLKVIITSVGLAGHSFSSRISPSTEAIPLYQCFFREFFYKAKVAIIHRMVQQN